MRSFLAIPALFVLGAVAESSGWGFTWTFSSGHSTWTSAYQTNATTTEVAASSTAPWSEAISATSYTVIYSSGSSTWGIPTDVSYSVANNFTNMIPASTTVAAHTVSVSVAATTTPATSVAATKTSAVASTYTGAAVPNFNGKIAGVGALAAAGLALVL